MRLPQVIQTVIDGYADRPALGQRAVEFITDAATGRTSAELLPRFDTITYRELSDRVNAAAAALTQNPVRPGDRVAILGFTSIDYTTIDMALMRLGAVSVPLQTSAPVTQLRPIAAETEPVAIASSVDFLDDAVELDADRPPLPSGWSCSTTTARWTITATRSRPQPRDWPKPPVVVETLADVLARGNVAAGATCLRLGRRHDLGAAHLHLGQHRRAERRDVHHEDGRQLVAPVQPSDVGQ